MAEKKGEHEHEHEHRIIAGGVTWHSQPNIPDDALEVFSSVYDEVINRFGYHPPPAPMPLYRVERCGTQVVSGEVFYFNVTIQDFLASVVVFRSLDKKCTIWSCYNASNYASNIQWESITAKGQEIFQFKEHEILNHLGFSPPKRYTFKITSFGYEIVYGTNYFYKLQFETPTKFEALAKVHADPFGEEIVVVDVTRNLDPYTGIVWRDPREDEHKIIEELAKTKNQDLVAVKKFGYMYVLGFLIFIEAELSNGRKYWWEVYLPNGGKGKLYLINAQLLRDYIPWSTKITPDAEQHFKEYLPKILEAGHLQEGKPCTLKYFGVTNLVPKNYGFSFLYDDAIWVVARVRTGIQNPILEVDVAPLRKIG